MAPALPDRPEMDAREVERLLGELSGADADLLRAIKTLEPDPDAMFPLVADLLEIGEGGASQEETDEESRYRERQARLERRCEALRRRLRLQQARATGRHAAEETAAAFCRAAKMQTPTKAGVRAFVDRLRSNVASPPKDRDKEHQLAPSAPNLAAAAGALRTQLSVVERLADSDATESSSGAESDDEPVLYTNVYQNPMPPTKRTLWKWVHERAAVAYRWTWLQAQIQELEYKIRQHNDLHKRMREAKGTSLLCEPSGYSGPLPGETSSTDTLEIESCARVRPLNQAVFRKRKLLQMHNLHTAAPKAAKPSNIRCICQWPLSGCAVCTGRVLPMHPLPASSTLTKRERLALVDPAFHPVLSSEKDVSASIQYSALMKDPQWQQRSARNSLKALKANVTVNKIPQPSNKLPTLPIKSHSKKKKRSKSKRRPNDIPSDLSRVLAKRRTSLVDGIRDEKDGLSPFDQGPHPSGSNSPVPSPSEHHRHRPRERIDRTRLNSSYDIDNIVIPHSIAASTKLEILQYKEIITPKWRIVEGEEIQTPNNGIIKKTPPPITSSEVKESDVEDISDTTIILRHERCEALEKGKYLQKRKSSRRHHSRSGTNSNPPLTPSETPPHTPATIVDETSMHSECGTSTSTSTTSTPTLSSTVVTSLPNSSNTTLTSSASTITTAAATTTNQSIQSVIQDSVSLSNNQTQIQCAPIINKRRSTLPIDEIEFVPPFSPRTFPLTEEIYTGMLLDMPDNHPLSNPENETGHMRPGLCNNGSDSESNSVLTFNSIRDNCVVEVGENLTLDPASESDADSYSVPPEEDPNDPEWNVSAKTD